MNGYLVFSCSCLCFSIIYIFKLEDFRLYSPFMACLKLKVIQLCLTLWDPHGLYSPRKSPGQNTEVGSCSLLQRIFPTQGSNPGIPNCRWILYQLSHQGSPRLPEWEAYLFSRRSSQPRNWTKVSCIAGRFFTNWAIRKAPMYLRVRKEKPNKNKILTLDGDKRKCKS